MGIKSLTQLIKNKTDNSIHNKNIEEYAGKKIALDASLFIYQSLMNYRYNNDFIKNKDGNYISHTLGIFNKLQNLISHNIIPVVIFDGKPPIEKTNVINARKSIQKKAEEELNNGDLNLSKSKIDLLKKKTIRITYEHIDEIKTLLNLMGVWWIHIDGEAEGIASELCRKGIVDYVMTEDMDSLVFETPKLIRKCVFKNVKNYEYSLFNLNEILEKLNMNISEFKDMCILMGCDYVQPITRIGNITAYKLIKAHGSIENIIKWNDINKKYDIPSDYLETYKNALYLFNIFKNKLDESIINKPKIDIINFKKYLQNVFNFNETKVNSTFNKLNIELEC